MKKLVSTPIPLSLNTYPLRLSPFSFIFILFSLFLLSAGTIQAQGTLWGMTAYGGSTGGGLIFKTNADGTNYTVEKEFTLTNPGARPFGALVLAYNGKLYGMTHHGGTNDQGVLFEYDPAVNIYTKKIDFDGTNGSYPFGSLVQANGKLYGMTSSGGTAGKGVLFEYTISTNTLTKKIDFNGTNGGRPTRSLVIFGSKLYGATSKGGANDQGVLFEYTLPANAADKGSLSTTIDFNGVNGGDPGDLVVFNNKLYGMAYSGGGASNGILFEYDPSTMSITKQVNFAGTNGRNPTGNLIVLNNKLYGMTASGGNDDKGVLFQYDPQNGINGIITKKIDFNGTNGAGSKNGLILLNSKLYGTTGYGGSNDDGILFEYDPLAGVNGTLTPKVDFNSKINGEAPGNLIIVNDKLYGMTSYGGSSDGGVLFEYNPPNGSLVKKIDFSLAPDGTEPRGDLIAVGTKLYGMTSYGGANNDGVLFEYDPAKKTFPNKLYFNGAINGNGANPYGSLVKSANGKLYGMTYEGGTNDQGVLFEYDPNGLKAIIKKIDFTGDNGANPQGSLIEGPNGKLYGVTYNGGVNDNGVLFEYDPGTNILITKIDFNSATNGDGPNSLIVLDNKMYGSASSGGQNSQGTLFEYDPSSNTLSKQVSFTGTNGDYPQGLIVAGSKLYGMTNSGGVFGKGVLFEYDPAMGINGTLSVKLNFTGANGRTPWGNLTALGAKLYGMTTYGGTLDKGVLFEYDLTASNGIYTKKLDFTGLNGASPRGSLLFIPGNNAGLSSLTTNAGELTVIPGFPAPAYKLSVDLAIASIQIIPTLADEYAKVMVNGVSVVSGTASQDIPLNEGNTAINVVVTAQNNTTIKTYKITITRGDKPVATASILPANILSPNDDGVNDVWLIENINNYPDNQVKIFDRSGRLLYSETGYKNTWNAKQNNIPLADDTYFYIIEPGPGFDQVKGFITIVH